MLRWMRLPSWGYAAPAIEAMNLNPFGGHVNLTAQGAKLLGQPPAYSGHPNPGAGQSSHSPAPFIAIEGDDRKDYEAERKPPHPGEQCGLGMWKRLHEEELPRAGVMPFGGAWSADWS